VSGTRIFLDTNILVSLHQGNENAKNIVNGKDIVISEITQIELLSYPYITPKIDIILREMLSQMIVFPLNEQIKEITINLRRKHPKLKLPDSLILATSIYLDMDFITADKGFSNIKEAAIIQASL